jgi:hypothetical protein
LQPAVFAGLERVATLSASASVGSIGVSSIRVGLIRGSLSARAQLSPGMDQSGLSQVTFLLTIRTDYVRIIVMPLASEAINIRVYSEFAVIWTPIGHYDNRLRLGISVFHP